MIPTIESMKTIGVPASVSATKITPSATSSDAPACEQRRTTASQTAAPMTTAPARAGRRRAQRPAARSAASRAAPAGTAAR